MDQPTPKNPAETMLEAMLEFLPHANVAPRSPVDDLTNAHLIDLPNGRQIKDLTDLHRAAAQYLKPARRKGTARIADLQSLINWANRFKGETSALFALPDMAAPTLTCIADYHAAGAVDIIDKTGDPSARHCHHRAIYNFPLSEEWLAWTKIDGKPLEKDDLGEFIEAQARDIADPTPAVLQGRESDTNQPWENRLIRTAQRIEGKFGQLSQLLALSKQFQVFESSDLKVSTNRDTGESEIQFLNEHRTVDGRPLNLPNLIIVEIPVFTGGELHRAVVRFRYRKHGGAVKFILSIYNPGKLFEAAFKDAVAQAETETELPLFLGTPES